MLYDMPETARTDGSIRFMIHTLVLPGLTSLCDSMTPELQAVIRALCDQSDMLVEGIQQAFQDHC